MQKASQKIEKVVLKNGLEVYFLFDKSFTTSSIQMCFKIGWRNDHVDHLGLAHLFEHLVGKRTQKYPGKSEFSKKLDEMGIITNALTGPDVTVYFQNQIHENILPSLDMFFEAIYFTNFHEEDLEKEKQVVLNEAREYLDNDDSVVWRQMVMNLFPGTTMEKFFFGDADSMGRITLHEFEEFYNIYRNPKNSMLFIATNESNMKDKIVKYLKKFYENKENQKLFSSVPIKQFKDVPEEIVKVATIEKPDRTQANLRLGYRINKLSKKERIAYGVLHSILLGGFSGTIIQKLRDDLGLIYWMQMHRNTFKQDIRYVMFATGCERTNKLLVINKIKETIKDTISEIIQSDVDRTIPQKIYNQKAPPNAFDDLSELMDSVLYGVEYIQPEEYLKMLKEVRVSEVKKLMKKIFQEENSSVVYLE